MASLSITRGQAYAFSYQHQHSVNNVASKFPLTGCTLYFTVKKTVDNTQDDSTAIIKATLTSFTDAPNGQTNVVLSPQQTSYINNVSPNYIAAGTYGYDIWVKESDGSPYQVDTGTFKITVPDTNRKV